MRLALLTSGSRGDVQPAVAVALGLRQAGYNVCVVANVGAESFVRSYGIEFSPLPWEPNADILLTRGRDAEPMPEFVAARRVAGNLLSNVGRQLAGLPTAYESRAHQHYLEALKACRSADAVMSTGPTFLVGYAVAEKLGIPFLPVLFDPHVPTRSWPGPYLAGLRLGPTVNLHAARLFRQLHWQFHRVALNRARQQVLGLQPLPVRGPFRQLRNTRQPLLFGFSPSVLPKPADWPEWYRVTGYWFLPQPAGWRPPSDLVRFLESGPPPVYIGFGSVHIAPATWTDRQTPLPLLDLVVSAMTRMRQRAIVLTGRRLIETRQWPPDVFPIESVPFDWLFPRVSAVIHHGGNGTTAAGLRAGRPTCVVPFHDTQAFWGWRVFDVGVGLQPIRPRHLTVARLAAIVEKLVNDAALREQAKAMGERIRSEDGVRRAVELVGQLIGPPRR